MRLDVVALGAARLVVIDGAVPGHLGVPRRSFHSFLLTTGFVACSRSYGLAASNTTTVSLRSGPDGIVRPEWEDRAAPFWLARFSLLRAGVRAPTWTPATSRPPVSGAKKRQEEAREPGGSGSRACRCFARVGVAEDRAQWRARRSLRRAKRLVNFQATQPKRAYRHFFMPTKFPATAGRKRHRGRCSHRLRPPTGHRTPPAIPRSCQPSQRGWRPSCSAPRWLGRGRAGGRDPLVRERLARVDCREARRGFEERQTVR